MERAVEGANNEAVEQTLRRAVEGDADLSVEERSLAPRYAPRGMKTMVDDTVASESVGGRRKCVYSG